MKSFFNICLFFLLFGLNAFGLDHTGWVMQTTAADNPFIIPFLIIDLDTGLKTVSALALRDDPYVGDIMNYLASRREGAGSRQNLILLTRLLAKFLSTDLEPESLDARINANKKELVDLLSTLPDARDDDLKMEMIRLIALTQDPALYHLILEEGRGLVLALAGASGYPAPPQEKLLYTIILAIRQTKIKEGRPVLSDIVRESRSRLLVDEARKTLEAL